MMPMKTISRFILAGALGISAAGFAQEDFHLSQYETAPLYLNPGQTGMFGGEKGDYRIATNYRSQWGALGMKPFTTAYISYDMPIRKSGGKWGAGGYLINNNAGPGRFNTLNVMGSGAYNIIDGSNEHYLTTGVQLGILYKSFNPSAYTFDVQYSQSTGTFDTGIDDQENFAKTSLVKLDANIGVFYKYIGKGKKYHPTAGFSDYNVTKPNESFTAYKSPLAMRFVGHAACDFDIGEDFQLRPKVLYMNQASATELNMGALLFYNIKNSTLDALIGCDYRLKDGIVAHIGFRQGGHYFRFSYDINTSYLNNYTGGRGAWEFSLILVGLRDQPLFQTMF
jgi:type IX secretion system PorP/SprF family membrane protein